MDERDLRPSTELTLIDRVCDQFEAAFKAGDQPKVDDYLDRVSQSDRDTLRRALQQVEVHYRRSVKGQTVRRDYFIESLVGSGLMTAEQVETFLAKLPPDEQPESAEDLAKLLFHRKKLTRFQAQAVYQGKAKGLVLGDYVVLDLIGQGGMGQVYKAQHKVMKRVVALKTLPTSATKSEQAVRRFHREVEVAARLSHPNIVTAHDAGESHGVHYLVMECVDGDDLGNLVQTRGRLPLATALDYIIQAAKGLQYAHSLKVIHRDIKPSNLLLDKKGTVKVLDMGLARLNKEVEASNETTDQTLTGTGQAMGTIDFMPPEQAENVKEADERSDIYSLGCTLFYFLTGRSVYGGDTTVMRLLAHRDAQIPSLRDERPDLPEYLDAVFHKMVAKKPGDRYASMTEVIAELEKCASLEPDQSGEATDLGNIPINSADAETQAKLKSDQTPGDQSLMLDLPVISPVETIHRTLPKKNNKVLFGSIIASVCFLLLAGGVVIALQSPEKDVASKKGTVGVQKKNEESPATRLESKSERGGGSRIPSHTGSSAAGVSPVATNNLNANWALEYGGKDDFVEIPSLKYDTSHPMTIEVWVRPTELKPCRVVDVGDLYGLSIASTGTKAGTPVLKWNSAAYISEGTRIQQRADHAVDLGILIHLATVYDGKDVRLYVNGFAQETPLHIFNGEEWRPLAEGEAVRLANV